ncbi:MAG: hypothetical protein HYW77_00545 [Parcubacteria group bacterium]|nr:hypothetical protein [Parcubacteria group bacterium]
MKRFFRRKVPVYPEIKKTRDSLNSRRNIQRGTDQRSTFGEDLAFKHLYPGNIETTIRNLRSLYQKSDEH